MRVRLLGLLLAALLMAFAGAQAQSRGPRDIVPGTENRIALVVGMSRYQYVRPLDNPKNDAKLMAETLKALGFTLVGGGAQLDLDKPAFDRAVQTFGQRIRGANVALFYYAGHGLQVQGANWLVPVTANPATETDLDFQMVDAALVLKQMEAAHTHLNLVILDACRNNPFGGRSLRATDGGLAQMKAPEGTLISYATQPGNVAQDGAGADSPFTKALATTMRKPGIDIFQMFNAVGLQVKAETAGTQQPWVSNSPIDGDFYFAGLPPSDAKPAPAPPPAIAANPPAPATTTAPTVTPSFDPRQVELTLWDSVKDSKDPADYREYLKQYPKGSFAGVARNRIKALQPAPQPAPVPSSHVATTTPTPPPEQTWQPAPRPSPQVAIATPPPEPANPSVQRDERIAPQSGYKYFAISGNNTSLTNRYGGWAVKSGATPDEALRSAHDACVGATNGTCAELPAIDGTKKACFAFLRTTEFTTHWYAPGNTTVISHFTEITDTSPDRVSAASHEYMENCGKDMVCGVMYSGCNYQ